MARFPTVEQLTADSVTNATQKQNFASWLGATAQLLGAAKENHIVLNVEGSSASFSPVSSVCILSLPVGTSSADLNIAPTLKMQEGNWIYLLAADKTTEITIKNQASGLEGRFSTLSGEDVVLSHTVFTMFRLVDGAWLQSSVSIAEDLPKATSTVLGGVKPDGVTTFTDENGVLSSRSFPLLGIMWSATGLVESGFLDLSQDNGLLLRSAYPQAWDKVQQAIDKNTGAVVTDEIWLAEREAHGLCGKFSTGDGATTFRLPLLRKMASFGFPDTSNNIKHGDYVPDQMQGHWHGGLKGERRTPQTEALGGGAMGIQDANAHDVYTDNAWTSTGSPSSDKSGNYGAVRFGNETHGPLIIYTPLMKVYGSVAEASEANIAELIQQTNTKIDTSEYERTAFGLGQKWVNVKSERNFDVTYTNTTDKPIFIIAIFISNSGGTTSYFYVDEVLIAGNTAFSGYSNSSVEVIVQPHSTYRVKRSSTNLIISNWSEFK